MHHSILKDKRAESHSLHYCTNWDEDRSIHSLSLYLSFSHTLSPSLFLSLSLGGNQSRLLTSCNSSRLLRGSSHQLLTIFPYVKSRLILSDKHKPVISARSERRCCNFFLGLTPREKKTQNNNSRSYRGN